MRDMVLDYYRRWRALGGTVIVATNLVDNLLPLAAGYTSLQLNLSVILPKYQGFVDLANGVQCTLPLTAADIPKPARTPCNPDCVWGKCYKGSCKCFRGYQGNDCSVFNASLQPNHCNNWFGVNVNGIAEYSTEWPFVDIFKMSTYWVTQSWTHSGWDTGNLSNFAMRDDNYPSVLPRQYSMGSLMVRDINSHYEQGLYVLLYDGDGVLNCQFDCIAMKRVQPGRIELTVVPSNGGNNGVFVSILWTNPNDPSKMPNPEVMATEVARLCARGSDESLPQK